MKPFFILFLISILGGGLNTISRINEYAKRAAVAYEKKDYVEAIAAYEYLLSDLDVQDDQLRLNLAHAYYQAGLLPQAQESYYLLADHPTQHLRAITHLQLGNIATKQQKYKQALSLYKQALIAEPSNEAARYNFELLKKYLDLHPEKAQTPPQEKLQAPEAESALPDSIPPPPPASDEVEPQPRKKQDANGTSEEEVEQPQPDKKGQQESGIGQGQGEGGQQGEQPGNQDREESSGKLPGDTKGQNPEGTPDPNQKPRGGADAPSAEDERAQTRRDRLQQINMSPEKARLLLDAMRNAELQYIQQLPRKSTRKPDHTKPDHTKPDW
ncbi:hypothetical protein CLV24_12525 [Pontibacter ummariensis]|uniref:Tetratricopeptide repeat-containing protein n=1 Tax=Pontibacter ummariensis TaxID=1610492 RepID=A0A239K0Y1_9BACT|nr:aerotolerance protein [Pontibacter ummariensis]PRY06820.1 hypothetical protein CLV24_12525 [Pontibacter ummariensis]SNT11675.1 Tetratricopeptide repeat-containing protein [Pontibacter ummariensis]